MTDSASAFLPPEVPEMDAASFDVEEWPFYWLSRVVGRYLRQMEAALKPIGLDVPRWRVLMVLHDGEPASVSEIAEHAIVKLPTMTKIIQRMQADGLVECRARETDGRVTEVILTDAGFAARDKAWTVAHSVYRRAFAGVKTGEKKMLNRLLRQVFETIGP
ncbi:MarR family transcriptional regulator [Sphingomonas oleivorans]|uniref:MarR family transcriptional regulator n=1 Tax=Sphingomonas oleivorans TaxID=1735121 RepID=A0A2T5G274_9SPHN|nr:MarR family winged helix-turn-helix transcriptional regulator [Sphingomonas oleivorans]PTQ13253.1 MarR family transcriptional regulator [Sphingomonas oleivorans]